MYTLLLLLLYRIQLFFQCLDVLVYSMNSCLEGLKHIRISIHHMIVGARLSSAVCQTYPFPDEYPLLLSSYLRTPRNPGWGQYTHINIIRQKLIGQLIFIQNVVIDRGSRQSAAEEEAE